MADNLSRLKQDVAALTDAVTTELEDVSNKLSSIQSGDSDEDVGAVADQVEALITKVKDFSATMEPAPDAPKEPPATGSNDPAATGTK